MSEIIAIANQKGGVAKTTIAHNLLVALALEKKRVLMVDLDSQASLTYVSGFRPPEGCEGHSIVEVLQKKPTANIQDCIFKVGNTAISGYLYLLPATIDLAQLESEMYGRTSREHILSKSLELVSGEYDYIILDCPPQLGLMTINALSCADGVIIPCKTDLLAYRGLQQLSETIKDVQELVNPKLQVYGVIATFYQKRLTQDNEVRDMICKDYRLISTMKLSTIASKGVFKGISAVEHSPRHEVSITIRQVAETLIKGVLRQGVTV